MCIAPFQSAIALLALDERPWIRQHPAPSFSSAIYMTDAEWKSYLTARLREAEEGLVHFNDAVTHRGLRIGRHRDITEEARRGLEEAVAEYRRLLCEQ